MLIVWERDRAGHEAESAFLTFLLLFLKSIPQRGDNSCIQMKCLEETGRKICLIPEQIIWAEGSRGWNRQFCVSWREDSHACRSTPPRGDPHQGALRPQRGLAMACLCVREDGWAPEDCRCPSVAQKRTERGPGDRHTCF